MQRHSASTTSRRKVPTNPPITAEIWAQNRCWRVDPAREPYIHKYWLSMPKSHRNAYLRAVAGKSRKAAITVFCLECVGWQPMEVILCTALDCPLYAYRPFQRARPQEKGAS